MRSILTGLFLTLSLTTSVTAQDLAIVKTNNALMREISPFHLVTNSYQGYFKDSGIPSGGAFISAVRANKVTAEDLMKSAIAKGRLSESKIEDKEYISHVNSLMENLDKD